MVCANEEEIARKRKSRKPNLIIKQHSGPVTQDMFDAPFSKWITIARELELLPRLVLDTGVQLAYLFGANMSADTGYKVPTVRSFHSGVKPPAIKSIVSKSWRAKRRSERELVIATPKPVSMRVGRTTQNPSWLQRLEV